MRGRWRSGKRPWARSTLTWPIASTAWRCSTVTKANTRRPSPLMSGRWRSEKRPLGRSTPTWPENLNKLAGLYNNQGQYAKAEPFYKRALAIWEKALGPEHPDEALSLENYAVLLRNMGRPEDAAPLDFRAKAIRAKHAFSESVATLQSPRDRLAGCSSWHLRFAVYSSGGNLSRRSFCWRLAGTCAFPSRTATSKSCSPSGICSPTTSRCGGGRRGVSTPTRPPVICRA